MKINPGIFKAYDIRAKYPGEINEFAVCEIAKALAGYFGRRAKIVVGHDVRLSSPALYQSVLNCPSVKSFKLKAVAAGLVTTPQFYFLVNKLQADGGIMITASHNPKDYNGLKVVKKRAEPMSGEEIKKLTLK